jgi:glycosyltransferase involved in cell wall biosynthesis
MLISAVVGVKNEDTLIDHCLRHLFDIGVDTVVVEDYGSTDSTLGKVAQWPSTEVGVRHFDESLNLDSQAWGRHEAELARRTGADWVLFLDADEFWLPRNGSIRELLSQSGSVGLTVERFNVVLRQEHPWTPAILGTECYSDLLLYADRTEHLRAELERGSGRSWIAAVPSPKIAVRPVFIDEIMPGHHGAVASSGRPEPLPVSRDCVIAHLPFTDYDRFRRKVSGIKASLEQQAAYHTGDVAWHWRRWAKLEDESQLEAEFQRQQINEATLQRLRNKGVIVSAARLLSPPNSVRAGQPAPQDTVKVSVHMPAYNHEKYIAEALDSALMQEADFPWEIVIGEDCSTDGTVAVARDYAARYPERIRLIENERNLGIWENDQVIVAACRGEYIAWLESDDLWTASDKLQRQVELLDANPTYSACFHRASCLTQSEPPSTWRGRPDHIKPTFDVDDLLEQGHFIPSCTGVFRAGLVREALDWTRGTPFLETAYAIRFALSGPIAYIDMDMATYRHHASGVYGRSDKVQNIRNAIEAHRLVGKGFGLTSRRSYRAGLARLHRQLASQLRREKRNLDAFGAWCGGQFSGV